MSAIGRRHHPLSLESLLDAICSSGESVSTDVTRWYDRDGGSTWEVNLLDIIECGLDSKVVHLIENEEEVRKDETVAAKDMQLYHEQCHRAAADAFGRIVDSTTKFKSKALVQLGNHIAAQLDFTLEKVQPSHRSGLKEYLNFANFVFTRGVFSCWYEPPASHWGCTDNKQPLGSTFDTSCFAKKPRQPSP
jgi:hypothetical protein